MYRKGRCRSVSLAITLLALGTPGSAQTQCDIPATNTGGIADRLSAMQACIAHQATLIEQLMERPVAPPAATLPKGLVAAFDDRDGCPQGWSPFVQSQGRVILGASFGEDDQLLSPPPPRRKFGAHGGKTTLQIEERHMPSHRHAMVVVAAPNGIGQPGTGSNAPYFDFRNRNPLPRAQDGQPLRAQVSNQSEGTLASGGSEPISIMPPYIALYFCKRN